MRYRKMSSDEFEVNVYDGWDDLDLQSPELSLVIERLAAGPNADGWYADILGVNGNEYVIGRPGDEYTAKGNGDRHIGRKFATIEELTAFVNQLT